MPLPSHAAKQSNCQDPVLTRRRTRRFGAGGPGGPAPGGHPSGIPVRTLVALAGGALLSLSALADAPTGTAGAGQPFANTQPTLGLNQVVQMTGTYPPRDGGDVSPTMAMVRTFAWGSGLGAQLPAEGQVLPISSNSAMFSLLGTNYGGDGRANFALPDLRGRIVVGTGQGAGLSGRALADRIGEAATALSVSQLPAHDHALPGAGSTGSQGGGQPFGNLQPSLSLQYVIAGSGVYPSSGLYSGGGGFIGEIRTFSGNFEPNGYLAADGRLLAISGNDALFAVLGTTYGGDGVNTFALPDLRGRTIIGAGQGSGLSNRSLGSTAGTEQVSLAVAQLPPHDHSLPSGTGSTATTGSGQPFDNLQPALALTYVIAIDGVYPSAGYSPGSDTVLGEVVAFAGNYAPGNDWAVADGSLLQISANRNLFSLIGTTYGGDGLTTFALPDLRGRTIAGLGAGTTLGAMTGTEEVSLTLAQLPIHDHLAPVPEPETYALLLAGLGMLGTLAHRRRRMG
jgi:microcystin-dependent protein